MCDLRARDEGAQEGQERTAEGYDGRYLLLGLTISPNVETSPRAARARPKIKAGCFTIRFLMLRMILPISPLGTWGFRRSPTPTRFLPSAGAAP